MARTPSGVVPLFESAFRPGYDEDSDSTLGTSSTYSSSPWDGEASSDARTYVDTSRKSSTQHESAATCDVAAAPAPPALTSHTTVSASNSAEGEAGTIPCSGATASVTSVLYSNTVVSKYGFRIPREQVGHARSSI